MMMKVSNNTIQVQAHTSSKKPRVEKRDDVLHVYTSAKAVDGQANTAITEDLAHYLGLSKSRVTIYRGLKSKNKLFKIT